MSTALPSNPLARTVAHFRDDHKVLIACDDTYAPKQYFETVELPRTEIVVIPTEDTKSYVTYVLNRLLQERTEDDDELWLVLDTDHCVRPNNVGHFSSEIGRAERAAVHVALSCPCFEYWLALFHAEPEELDDLHTAKELERRLGELVAKFRKDNSGYSKVNVQTADYPDELLPLAIRRAARQDSQKVGRIPAGNTTRVYLLWRSILSRFEEFQVPLRYLPAYKAVKENSCR